MKEVIQYVQFTAWSGSGRSEFLDWLRRVYFVFCSSSKLLQPLLLVPAPGLPGTPRIILFFSFVGRKRSNGP